MNINQANLNKHLYISYTTNDEINGIVHISHGMAEHVGRYQWLISKFNDAGYHVYAANHRGHGSWIEDGHRSGYFSDKNGWELVTEDLRNNIIAAQKNHPELKQFLIGHSMGSWIALSVVQSNINIDGLILSGSAKLDTFSTLIQSSLVNLIFHLKGKYHESLLMHKVTMQKFNSFFKPNNTPNDWISSDRESVDQYTKDPLCGFVVTIGLWKDTIDGLKQIFLKDRYKNVNNDLPIYVISGDKDPVGANGKLAKKLFNFLNSIFKNVSFDLISNARHEVFTESSKEANFYKVLSFMNKYC